MPTFRYAARSASGQLSEGTLEANDRSAAILRIESEYGMPIRVEGLADGNAQAARKEKTAAAAGAPTSLPIAQQFLFTEQLAHLLSAGMTLDEALAVLVKRLKHPRVQGLCHALHEAVINGRSLSQALREYPKIFSALYVNMVAAGEASGTLSDILRRLVVHLADVKSLRDRVQQALIYPAILVGAGVVLILVFMTVMVPQIEGFFSQTGQPLPLPTRMLLGANEVITGYWWAALLLGIGGYATFKALTRSGEGRRAWDAFTLRIPGYGLIIRYRFYAQFARTLGTLIENGVTLLRALELLEGISGNEHIRQRIVLARQSVMDGASLSIALQPHAIFPELFLDMMAVGEQTGRFGETMQMIADVYERELDKQVQIVSALIPPLVMAVIALIVGLVIYGILSAVFNLTAGLRTRVG